MRHPWMAAGLATLAASCAVGETDSVFLGTFRPEAPPAEAGCPDRADDAPGDGRVRLVPGSGASVVRIQESGCALRFAVRDGRAEAEPGQICVRSGVDDAGVAWTETLHALEWVILPGEGERLGEAATLERVVEAGGAVTVARRRCARTLVRVAR